MNIPRQIVQFQYHEHSSRDPSEYIKHREQNTVLLDSIPERLEFLIAVSGNVGHAGSAFDGLVP